MRNRLGHRDRLFCLRTSANASGPQVPVSQLANHRCEDFDYQFDNESNINSSFPGHQLQINSMRPMVPRSSLPRTIQIQDEVSISIAAVV